jgi:L-lactate dehydrogenase complex protein LldE
MDKTKVETTPFQVSLFTTCLTDSFFPDAAIATVRLLRHLGCEVDLPENQICCGQPQFNNGYHDQARKMARNFIDAFAESLCVVSPSASCTAMIRDYYESLFTDDPHYLPLAQELVSKSYEITEFITKILRIDLQTYKPQARGKVTYHYSCHNRGIDIPPQVTIDLINLIDGVEYIPLDKMDQCCGFGGTFAVKMPEISQALVADKAKCILATGADTVVVNDGGCMLNIAGYCHRHNIPVRFVHIAQLLAESLGLLKDLEGQPS